jgi:hypothetical protein
MLYLYVNEWILFNYKYVKNEFSEKNKNKKNNRINPAFYFFDFFYQLNHFG